MRFLVIDKCVSEANTPLWVCQLIDGKHFGCLFAVFEPDSITAGLNIGEEYSCEVLKNIYYSTVGQNFKNGFIVYNLDFDFINIKL